MSRGHRGTTQNHILADRVPKDDTRRLALNSDALNSDALRTHERVAGMTAADIRAALRLTPINGSSTPGDVVGSGPSVSVRCSAASAAEAAYEDDSDADTHVSYTPPPSGPQLASGIVE